MEKTEKGEKVMNPENVLLLIQIATKLASVIDDEVSASNSTELQNAWNEARSMYDKGFEEAYTSK